MKRKFPILKGKDAENFLKMKKHNDEKLQFKARKLLENSQVEPKKTD